MTAHALAKLLLEVSDFEVRIMHHDEAKGNTVYEIYPNSPSQSASGLIWIGAERLYGPQTFKCEACGKMFTIQVGAKESVDVSMTRRCYDCGSQRY